MRAIAARECLARPRKEEEPLLISINDIPAGHLIVKVTINFISPGDDAGEDRGERR
jgi:hypothetical protein